jgi:hypothetical protein
MATKKRVRRKKYRKYITAWKRESERERKINLVAINFLRFK